jgi:hypothetical protein
MGMIMSIVNIRPKKSEVRMLALDKPLRSLDAFAINIDTPVTTGIYEVTKQSMSGPAVTTAQLKHGRFSMQITKQCQIGKILPHPSVVMGDGVMRPNPQMSRRDNRILLGVQPPLRQILHGRQCGRRHECRPLLPICSSVVAPKRPPTPHGAYPLCEVMPQTGAHQASDIVNHLPAWHISLKLQNLDPAFDDFRSDVLKPADQLVHHVKEQAIPAGGQPL